MSGLKGSLLHDDCGNKYDLFQRGSRLAWLEHRPGLKWNGTGSVTGVVELDYEVSLLDIPGNVFDERVLSHDIVWEMA